MAHKEKKFNTLEKVAKKLREDLHKKDENGNEINKHILLFAHNGIGKTRLSMAFKDLARTDNETDTLYFNAYTEDLFSWSNDLEEDTNRLLIMNTKSNFFSGLESLEMETRIRPLLHRYADFDFLINYEKGEVRFLREEMENIKISRGEENIFIWCFFLAIVELAIEKDETYNWVKYIYIDDPISSLDENNAIAVACHLAQVLKDKNDEIKTIISSHHALFFNVMYNELEKKSIKLFFSKNNNQYSLKNTSDAPSFHHVALLKELLNVARTGKIYTYHFNILRSILEKTAVFHGFDHFSECIKQDEKDTEGNMHKRMTDLFSHGKYSIFDPKEMVDDNKEHFKTILRNLIKDYQFNPKLIPKEPQSRKKHPKGKQHG